MPIYKINQGDVSQLPLQSEGFGNEFALRDFFAANLEDMLGIKFLEKEYQIPGGRIDTIGIDENYSPVIIEYKWKSNDEVLTQGLFYLDWLLSNKSHFILLVKARLGSDVEINWNQPRLILIAQGFNKYIKAAVGRTDYVELKTYKLYQGNIFQLEDEFTPKTVKPFLKTKNFDKTVVDEFESIVIESSSTSDTIGNGDIEYSLDYHVSCTSEEMKKYFFELRERILLLPDVEEKADQKSGITYRTNRSFTRLEFKGTWIQVLLRQAHYNFDSFNLVKDVTTFRWGFKGMFKFQIDTDIEYLFALIKESFNSTL